MRVCEHTHVFLVCILVFVNPCFHMCDRVSLQYFCLSASLFMYHCLIPTPSVCTYARNSFFIMFHLMLYYNICRVTLYAEFLPTTARAKCVVMIEVCITFTFKCLQCM